MKDTDTVNLRRTKIMLDKWLLKVKNSYFKGYVECSWNPSPQKDTHVEKLLIKQNNFKNSYLESLRPTQLKHYEFYHESCRKEPQRKKNIVFPLQL